MNDWCTATGVQFVERLAFTQSQFMAGKLEQENITRINAELLAAENAERRRRAVAYLIKHYMRSGEKYAWTIAGLIERELDLLPRNREPSNDLERALRVLLQTAERRSRRQLWEQDVLPAMEGLTSG